MAQLSIIDLITRKTAVQLNIPESIVEIVIKHKWKSVYEAQYLHTTIEDSGLGKFSTRDRVVINKLAKMNFKIDWINLQLQDGNITDKLKVKYLKMLEQFVDEKAYLESKI
jgi:hypothetical protein